MEKLCYAQSPESVSLAKYNRSLDLNSAPCSESVTSFSFHRTSDSVAKCTCPESAILIFSSELRKHFDEAPQHHHYISIVCNLGSDSHFFRQGQGADSLMTNNLLEEY